MFLIINLIVVGKQIEEVEKAANCQLIIYAFAAQQLFFDKHNSEKINDIIKISTFPYSKENQIKIILERKVVDFNYPYV